MFHKCKSWPVVLADDDGIRPAGRPDACFYCGSKVGEPHDETCVCVQSLVLYSIHADGRQVGTFKNYEPWHWDAEQMEFMRNESSWCKSDALDAIEWTDENMREKTSLTIGNDGCCCRLLEFRFERVIDDGPFVELREPATSAPYPAP